MSGKAYPEYKDSGIEWLGDVPIGWHVERLRYNILTNPTKTEVKSITGNTMVSFVPMEAVCEYGGLNLEQTKYLDEVKNGYTYFRDGDVLVAKITPCFENGKGSIAEGLEKGIGFGTTELHVLRPQRKLNFKYLFYLTISHAFRQIGKSYMYGAGGQKRVPENFIRNLRHPIPHMSEQHSIVSFLDRETECIDSLIAKKERQIELLQEKRAALISHAVTKGLNPDVKIKDSGIEWLGEIPEHWESISWRRVTKILTDYTANGSFAALAENVIYLDEPEYARLIRLTDLRTGVVPGEGVFVSEDSYKFLAKSALFGGEFLIANVGAYSGLVCEMPKINMPATLGPNMMLAKFIKSKVDNRFMIYAANSEYIQTQLRTKALSSAAQPKLNKDDFRSVLCCLPPFNEQCSIVTFLDRETEQIDTLIGKVKESITKLREYRTALISAVVTGKIDVRKEVA